MVKWPCYDVRTSQGRSGPGCVYMYKVLRSARMELEETSVSIAPVPSDSLSAVSKQTLIFLFGLKFIDVCHSLYSRGEQTDNEKDIQEYIYGCLLNN